MLTYLTKSGLVTPYGAREWVNIGSGNSALPDGTKLSSDATSTYHLSVQWHSPESNSTRNALELNLQHVFGDHTFVPLSQRLGRTMWVVYIESKCLWLYVKIFGPRLNSNNIITGIGIPVIKMRRQWKSYATYCFMKIFYSSTVVLCFVVKNGHFNRKLCSTSVRLPLLDKWMICTDIHVLYIFYLPHSCYSCVFIQHSHIFNRHLFCTIYYKQNSFDSFTFKTNKISNQQCMFYHINTFYLLTSDHNMSNGINN